jgi:3-deoxy-D-manno-octulosonic-acid transferase
MENFREIADAFDRAAAWRRVRDAGELAAVWASWLDDPPAARALGASGRALVETNRGALQRTVALVQPLLGSA